MKRYGSVLIAKYVVKWYSDNNFPISHLKLQAILYIIQNNLLRRRLSYIGDDFFAWRSGPILLGVSMEYSCYNNMNIFDDDFDDYDFSIISEPTEKIILKVLLYCKKLNGWDLVDLVKYPNHAWFKVYDKGKGERDLIPKDLILNDSLYII